MTKPSTIFQAFLVVWLAAAPALLAAHARTRQDGGATPAPAAPDQSAPAAPAFNPEIDAATMPLQQYTDPSGRFGFVAPAQWGRLPSASGDDVTFQSDSGDSIRVSVSSLKVDAKSFSGAYVDTYMKVLAQSFTDVKYIGQRNVEVSFRKATDYVFSAEYGNSPVTCHQVVLLGADKVLYVTFAGFGGTRAQSEQLFQTAVHSLWVSPSFGGTTTAGVSDPNAPAYVIAIPEGWMDQGAHDGNSHMFRPPGSRPTSAFVSTRVAKIAADDKLKVVDDTFVAAYAESIRGRHPQNTFELRQARRIFLGGEAAVRYDYGYVSNYGVRRAILILCVRNGYLVGISCDSAEQSYNLYEQAFEGLVSGFKFK